ncbi:hypothetical protein C4546_02660 [Candidatus Parcubacteria bacterium]|jgi:hypothetical protein|nr:MAG: hypothetical protein C4546_02660 [Candidatus Parcubacteria bacterium]
MKGKTILLLVFALIGLEAASFLAWRFPSFGVFAWLIIVGLVVAVSLVKLEFGLSWVIAELILGGKGYLFSLPLGNFDLSIRLGIFSAVFLVWVLRAVKTKNFWGSQYNFRWLWIGLGGIVVWAGLIGLLRGNGLKAVFLDANAFLFLGLVPAFGCLKSRKDFFSLCNFIAAALIVLALKTGLTQGLFNHLPSTSLADYYKWIRDTGVGEITFIIGHLYRVFFQSQVFGLLGFFLGIGLVMAQPKFRWLWTGVAGLSVFVVITSLSRSFWLGGGVALVMGLIGLLAIKSARQGFGRVIFHSAVAGLIGYLGFMWVLNFPYLWGGGIQGGSLVRIRTDISSESAASSRKELLPVINQAILDHPYTGSGFGTALTYRTKDPRVNKNGNAQGTLYTTTAFELGYNALALQFGLPFFLGYLLVLFTILKKGIVLFKLESRHRAIIAGLVLSLIAVFALHATTPYLNHPLGLGILMLALCAFAIFDPRYERN